MTVIHDRLNLRKRTVHLAGGEHAAVKCEDIFEILAGLLQLRQPLRVVIAS
jgi:hypothetical protein